MIFKKKKAAILLRDLEYIYQKEKKDYTYYLLKRVFSKKENPKEWYFFNDMVRIIATKQKVGNYGRKVCQKERILQVLQWLGLQPWSFEENNKTTIHIMNFINWEWVSRKKVNNN